MSLDAIEIYRGDELVFVYPHHLTDEALAGSLVAVVSVISSLPDTYMIKLTPGNFDVDDFIAKYRLPNHTNLKYAWFIAINGEHHWYQFDTTTFIDAFINIFNHFNIDYRTYVKGPPYRITHQGLKPMAIKGYDIPLNKPDDPVIFFPVYTNTIEIGLPDRYLD